MPEFIHFYKTGDGFVRTFRLSTQEFESEGQTHTFTDAQDALSKSTPLTAVVWDGKWIGIGTVGTQA